MINFREVFNVRYGIFFIVFILVLFFLLLVVNRNNIRDSFRLVSKILFFSGIVSIVMVWIFRICINVFVGNLYKVFVSVISDSLCNNLFYRGIVNILLGILLYVIYYFMEKKSKGNVKYS